MEKGADTNTQVISDKDWNNFLKHVVVEDNGVWRWTGAKNRENGYGVFGIDGKLFLAHRVSWMKKHGAIPAGLNVLHFNDDTTDVNPDHLFLGTQRLNLMDAAKKGRLKGRKTRGKDICGGELKYILHRMKVGHSLNSIGKELGRSVGSLCNLRNRHGIPKEGLIQTAQKAFKSLDETKAVLEGVFAGLK